jgi:dTDP-4-dehydrorhamnose 3,5-epimerase
MRSDRTRLGDPILFTPDVHGDDRGFFVETFRQRDFDELPAPLAFVQDNHSRSGAGIVRGMHFQPGQAKLVRCVRGAILDVIVDIRVGSPSFGQWEAFELDDRTHHQLLVPDGFAHGFCVLSEVADVVYKVTAYYDPPAESGFAFDDPAVGIAWPEHELIASNRDRTAPTLAQLADGLPFRYAAA